MRTEERQLIETRHLLLRLGQLQEETIQRLEKTNQLLERQSAVTEELLAELRDFHRKIR